MEELESVPSEIDADAILPPVTKPRSFPGTIPSHSALDPNIETYERDKWERGHEQRRLKAYLKGKQLFAHGRTRAYPVGFRPIMWPVTPKPEA